MLSAKQISDIRSLYKHGTRVVIETMHDQNRVPYGTAGTVKYVDDEGTIFVAWDNGSSLGILPEIDTFHLEIERK
jgi:hypothetical protein